MTPQTATVIITAPVPQVYDYLANPRNLRRYLCGAVPATDDSSPHVPAADESSPHVLAADESSPHVLAGDDNSPRVPAARWAFYAEGSAHRLHWQLLAPRRALGVLDVYGDCSVSQLWLTTTAAPDDWPAGQLRAIMRAVLHRIREQVEDDPTHNRHPALSRSA